MGYAADVAANGLEAVAAIERQSYDLVLMDVQMPEMDGLQATEAIRRTLPADRQPTIIAMTAAAMPEDRQQCLDAGMDGYIAKPVRLDELTAALLCVAWRNGRVKNDGQNHRTRERRHPRQFATCELVESLLLSKYTPRAVHSRRREHQTTT